LKVYGRNPGFFTAPVDLLEYVNACLKEKVFTIPEDGIRLASNDVRAIITGFSTLEVEAALIEAKEAGAASVHIDSSKHTSAAAEAIEQAKIAAKPVPAPIATEPSLPAVITFTPPLANFPQAHVGRVGAFGAPAHDSTQTAPATVAEAVTPTHKPN
jgi:hypothetical protein